jgi:small-conductance mechanosensitive channel
LNHLLYNPKNLRRPAVLDGFSVLVKPILNALLIGFGGFLLAFIVSQILNRLLARPMGNGWSKFIASLSALVIAIWTIMLILDSAGAAGLVVVLVTAVTGAFALGSERIAGDLVSGVSLFVAKTYAVGDYVLIGGHEGKVHAISLMMTTLESIYGDRIFIRNSEVTNGTIVNYSIQPGHLVSVVIPLPASQDLNAAVDAIEKAIHDYSSKFENSPYKPAIVIERAEDGYVMIEVRVYVTERLDYGPEKTRLFLSAFNAMKNAGLELLAE